MPRQFYRSYLSAPQWSKFGTLRNEIIVEIPQNVDASSVDEQEYQNMIEQQRLEEEALSPIEEEDNPEEPASVRARKAARANVNKGLYFTHLFNGASLGTPTSSETEFKGTRIFINPKDDAKLISVLLDGVEKIGEMEGNSLVIPSTFKGSLKILTEGSSGIDTIESAINGNDECTVFDAMGRVVATGLRNSVESRLNSGIYIIKSGSKTEKIAIR